MPLTVCLADDHKVVRDGLRMIIESKGDMTIVGEAADGRTAVRQIQKLLPDVAVLDVAMPEMNGIEAIYQIRRLSPATAVVVLSMFASSEHLFRAMKAGALGYVLKEAAADEVVAAIRSVHNGRRYLSSMLTDRVIDAYMEQRSSSIDKSPLEKLSPREREILQLVAEGNSSAGISEIVHLSAKTVETYRSRLMKKLKINSLSSLIKFAVQHGITTVEN